MVRLGAGGAPVRTPDLRAADPKTRVAKNGKEPDGDLYRISVAPKKELVINLVFRPQVRMGCIVKFEPS